ncbi:MAG: hypothetical protein A2864_02220 [Candidatus Woykebacteria bacterium RIFCSPHIGHO2_01_FULL_39_12]|uniref:DNA 3'-5' helicase n=1 Tax=Candidatus Woykebacteria bacterium RIFCSPHIGHO2_01_FULL_39_12 TaxID=1802599 RepID=A0A1G1WJT5_9BACT|nr:MAG: hypothetical protein A2864_02220 [Candidatus Woykebacteria bacterium RIFCSPHIGHO2_01_FULL_39_12]
MSTVLSSLNSKQKEAVKHSAGPALVLSGPGSGKTRVITHRIAYLINEEGVKPSQIIAVTFTNKASNEMRGRLKNLIGKESFDLWVGTFHSTCSKILRANGKFLGISPKFLIYDESDSLRLVKDILIELNIDLKQVSAASIRSSIEGAKNELIDSAEYISFSRGYFQEVVGNVYRIYQKKLSEYNALDFEDLLMQTVRLFQNYPEILDTYQKKFKYILVDEYQDTNRAQYVFSKLLATNHRNIFVVGDAAQAIYGWRGADFRNILNFSQDFPEGKIFNLAQNYRSSKKIVAAAKSVISKNTSHPMLDLWTDNDDGLPIILYEAVNENDEAAFVLRTIEKLKSSRQGFSLSSFAVLYRTNAQSRSLEEAFLAAGIPYILVGGVRFYERREIKDVLAYLRNLSNPKDLLGYKRIVNIPPRGIGTTTMQTPNHPKLVGFNSLLDELREQVPNQTTMGLIDLILTKTKYLDYLEDGTEEGRSRIENVKELRSVASEFPKLSDFLENVSLIEKEYLPPKPSFQNVAKEAVTLMTLHAAKGLEFPVVFMVGMEENLLPHLRSLNDLSELEEERRLCYVGMTRAQKQLYLTYATKRLYFGAKTEGILSRFVLDIPEELLIPIRF